MPASWTVSYRKDGQWQPVPNASGYGTASDQLNVVHFDPLETAELRLEIKMRDGFSAGLLQLKKD